MSHINALPLAPLIHWLSLFLIVPIVSSTLLHLFVKEFQSQLLSSINLPDSSCRQIKCRQSSDCESDEHASWWWCFHSHWSVHEQAHGQPRYTTSPVCTIHCSDISGEIYLSVMHRNRDVVCAILRGKLSWDMAFHILYAVQAQLHQRIPEMSRAEQWLRFVQFFK